MKNSNFVKLGLLLIISAFIVCQSDADLDRRTKAVACIYLLKSALFHQGEDYFPRVLKNLEFSSAEDLTQKWTEKALINCFSTVSLIKSADLIGRKKPENISPLAKENKEILSLKNYKNKYEADTQKLAKDSEKLRKALEELKSELGELEAMVRNFARPTYNSKKREEQQENRRNLEEEREESGGRYENSNLNLSLITRLDPNIKLMIFFGVLLIFVIFFMWGYKTLTAPKDKTFKKQKIK
jgi:hypothetical protein